MNKLTRRNFLYLLGASALAAGSLSACTQTNAEKHGDNHLRFVLDWVPNTNHTGIYVARELGFYSQRGLDVDIIQPPEDGADALVGTGAADFGVSYQDGMAHYLGSPNPIPVTAVAAILQHNTSGIFSAQTGGITRPRDLAGKRYATWNQELEQAILRSVIEADGGKWEDVVLVPNNTTDEIAGLMSDEFDAVWVYEGWTCQNARLQQFDYDYFAFADLNPQFDYYTPVLIANNDLLTQRPHLARAFLEATKEGYEYAAAHPREAADMLLAQVPELEPSLVYASQEFLAPYYLDTTHSWGAIDQARWDSFFTWMQSEGLLEQAIPAGEGLDMSYLGVNS